MQNSGGSRRGNADACADYLSVVMAREGGQSSTPGILDQSLMSLEYRVARSSRAMTTECAARFSRRDASELKPHVVPRITEGAGNAGRPMRPQPRV